MDDWIIFMGFLVVIALLYAIINKDKKKPSAKEMAEIKAKQKKAMKIMYWIIAIIVIIFIIFFVWIYDADKQHVSCTNECSSIEARCRTSINNPNYCESQWSNCINNC